MLLSLLNKKEKLKFLDLAMYMVAIDGEPDDFEKRLLTKFFADSNQVVKNIVYLNLVIISMEDDLYNTSELLFLETIQKELNISAEKRRELISIVYAERDLREKTIRIVKN